jgi:hypothetical protein
VVVVETGSFSGAGRQLRVGQPAVSKSVAKSEEYLEVKLLTRSTRGSLQRKPALAIWSAQRRPRGSAFVGLKLIPVRNYRVVAVSIFDRLGSRRLLYTAIPS